MSATLTAENVPQMTIELKRSLRDRKDVLATAYREAEEAIRREAEEIANQRDKGQSIIPEVDFKAITEERVSNSVRDQIRHRGAAVIRGVFPRAQAETWNDQLGDYIASNGYYEAKKDPSLDQYFNVLASSKPQIFGIYWSKPQVEARQAPELATARRFLNRLWKTESGGKQHFDPDREATYADRTRRRQPGDRTLGLSPHMDSGSVERWLDADYRNVYRHVFSGDWRKYEPFDAESRADVNEIPSPAVCHMFRTFQGWTALTRQGPSDGTLQLIPIANSIVYMLLRALQDDVPEDELCGAKPGRALSATKEWHAAMLPALSSIPLVEPGDTVWWHPDIIHAVEDLHAGTGYSNVIYIGSAPWCRKNAAYLEPQKAAFLEGRSPPDFAPENFEVNYKGRATAGDLTELGRKQMGLETW